MATPIERYKKTPEGGIVSLGVFHGQAGRIGEKASEFGGFWRIYDVLMCDICI